MCLNIVCVWWWCFTWTGTWINTWRWLPLTALNAVASTTINAMNNCNAKEREREGGQEREFRFSINFNCPMSMTTKGDSIKKHFQLSFRSFVASKGLLTHRDEWNLPYRMSHVGSALLLTETADHLINRCVRQLHIRKFPVIHSHFLCRCLHSISLSCVAAIVFLHSSMTFHYSLCFCFFFIVILLQTLRNGN